VSVIHINSNYGRSLHIVEVFNFSRALPC